MLGFNMECEIFEAITEYWAKEMKDEQTAIDCLFYLKQRLMSAEERNRAETAIEQMGYCPKCGDKLETVESDIPHPELDGTPTEHWTNIRCPQCDKRI